MRITLGVDSRVFRVCVASVSLWLGVFGCGDSKSDSEAVGGDAGDQNEAPMGGTGGSNTSGGESGSGGGDPGPDAGSSTFEDPFPDDIILPMQGPCTPAQHARVQLRLPVHGHTDVRGRRGRVWAVRLRRA